MGNPLAYLGALTTTQLLLVIAGLFVGLFLIKTMFTRGGPRGRMKGNAAVWIIIPLVLAVGAGLAWVVFRLVGNSQVNLFFT